MQGHLIYEIGNLRFVALPRDRRNAMRCAGCAMFCVIIGQHVKCPVDKDGNLICKQGHGLTWKRIPWPKPIQQAAERRIRRS